MIVNTVIESDLLFFLWVRYFGLPNAWIIRWDEYLDRDFVYRTCTRLRG